MRGKTENGLCLRQTIEARRDVRAWLSRALWTAALACSLSLSLGETAGLWTEISPLWALAPGAALCAMELPLWRRGQERWLAPLTLVALLAAMTLFSRTFSDGACLAVNRFCEKWTAQTGTLLTGVAVTAEKERLCLGVFCCASGLLLTLAARWLVPNARALAAVLPLLGVLAAILTKSEQIPAQLLLLALCGALSSGAERGAHGAAALVTAAAVLALTLLTGLSSALPRAEDWSRRTLHTLRYEGEARLPEGDFRAAPPERGEEVALRVTMQTPQTLYLRGFVGERFEDGQWLAQTTQSLAEDAETVYTLHRSGFYAQAQLSRAAEGEETAKKSTVTVETVGACARYLYAPYTLCRESCEALLPPERLSNGAMEANGETTATYAVLCDAQELAQTLSERLSVATDTRTLRYRQEESAYRAIVQKNALALSEEVRRTLAPTLEACRAEEDGASTQEAAQAATLRFLRKYFSGETPEEGLPALPLETAAGSTFQLATATVLALRYYGVPARYVEGYVLTEEMAAGAENTPIDVPASCGRAWAEVYQEGLGWMPVDLTPAFSALAGEEGTDGVHLRPESGESASDARTDESGAAEDAEELDPEPEEETETPSSAPETKASRLSRALWWLPVPVLLLLAVLALALRRRYLLKKRARLFSQPDCAEAVACLFSDAARLLEEMGLSREGGAVARLFPLAEERFGQDYAAHFRAAAALNAEALFSSHPFTPEQRALAREFHAQTVCLARRDGKIGKRLCRKWLQCLY